MPRGKPKDPNRVRRYKWRGPMEIALKVAGQPIVIRIDQESIRGRVRCGKRYSTEASLELLFAREITALANRKPGKQLKHIVLDPTQTDLPMPSRGVGGAA